MEYIYVVDVIELYSIIGGLILVGIGLLGVGLYYLYDNYISYWLYHLKKKIK